MAKFRLRMTAEFEIPDDEYQVAFANSDPVDIAVFYNDHDPIELLGLAQDLKLTDWRVTALIDRAVAAMRLEALLLHVGAQVRDKIE